MRLGVDKDFSNYLASIGAAIRATRRSLGISQEELAHLADLDRSHMGKIERGERNVSLLNLIRIASALHTRPSDILALAGR